MSPRALARLFGCCALLLGVLWSRLSEKQGSTTATARGCASACGRRYSASGGLPAGRWRSNGGTAHGRRPAGRQRPTGRAEYVRAGAAGHAGRHAVAGADASSASYRGTGTGDHPAFARGGARSGHNERDVPTGRATGPMYRIYHHKWCSHEDHRAACPFQPDPPTIERHADTSLSSRSPRALARRCRRASRLASPSRYACDLH